MKESSGLIVDYENIIKNQHKISMSLNDINKKTNNLKILCADFIKTFAEMNQEEEEIKKRNIAWVAIKLFYGDCILDDLKEKRNEKQQKKAWLKELHKLLRLEGILGITHCPICEYPITKKYNMSLHSGEYYNIMCENCCAETCIYVDDLA